MPSAATIGSKTIDVIGYPCSARGRGLRTAVTAAHYLAARGARVRQLRGTTLATTIDLIRERLSRPDRPEVIDTEALLVTVGNIGRTGGKRICPGARLDDGLLEITVIGSAPRGRTLRLLTALAAGRAVTHPAVTYHQAAAVSVWCPAGSAIVDGASLDARPCTARVLRGAQAVLVP
ncbi:hypothetical protein NBRGN_110_03400 [Nocardia brasiliensis NBRC 14402]|uniref:diacylglycerol/lipid kinase family protein n=1 Tax=Nocardia brasiliensis TaxID=37326 RepID=UPI0002E482BA|nr:hypothetical protein [Nocardia brasiliensis]ASF09400.1 hypothetical protein CEQ30_20820 [Nocardia brasiliensis]GAJ86673.1 hypothetical protein NBRGN_110_03400 [Nocardia brasiliensis NBRC 14402]SUB39904.1 Diacylglycerol kinase [Nocardia brasiliensis]